MDILISDLYKYGKLRLGKWKNVFFVELDPMRERELIVTFLKGQN